MDRFSVGRAIAHAYGFLFRRILSVIALSWVAAALYAALRFAQFRTEPLLKPLEHPGIAAFHLVSALVSLLLLSAIAISLTRAALGEHRSWTLAHLEIGARELRLFAALIGLVVLLIAVIVASVAAVMGAGWGIAAALTQWPAIAQGGLPVARIAHGVVAVLVSLAATYVMLRASFLLFPVAAAEDKADLMRAWQLGGGNVLRMFVVTLAVVVPAYVVFAAIGYALLGGAISDAVRAMFGPGAHDPAPFMALLADHAETLGIASAIMLVILTALEAGASASAYAALTGSVGAEEAVPVSETHAAYAEAAEVVSEAPEHDDHAHEAVAAHDEHGHDAHEAHGHDDHGAEAHEAHADEGHGHEADTHAGDGHEGDGHAAPADDAQDHADDAHDQPEDMHGHDDHGHDAHAAEPEHHEAGHEDDAHAVQDDHGPDEQGREPHVDAVEAGHGEQAQDDAAHAGPVHDEVVHDEQGHDAHAPAAQGDHDHELPEDDSHRHAAEALELTEEVAGEAPDATEPAGTRTLEHA